MDGVLNLDIHIDGQGFFRGGNLNFRYTTG